MTSGSGRRLFRTVLFTDIVGSTKLAAEQGDRHWRRTLATHHAAIRRELKRHHGREIDTAGDGFFAVFESPTDAVRCAAAAVAATHSLGLPIRAGVHTGELEPAGAKYGGIAVHIAARLLSLAGPEEVLVSSTVRELVAGSGHAFDDRGVHELKGVPGEWHLYSLALPRFEEGVPLVGVDDDELRAVATRRQRLVVAALLMVIVVLVAGLGGFFLLANQPPPLARGPNTVAIFQAANPDPVRSFAVDRGPADVALGDGSYWTANMDAGTVSRIVAGSGAVTSLGQAGARPTALAVTPGRVWVVDRYSSRLTMFDARNATLLGGLPLHASAITAADGQLWVSDDINDRVVRIDLQSGAKLAEIALDGPAGPTDLAMAGAQLWVAAPRADAVLRIDPASGAVSENALGLPDVRGLSASSDDLWAISPSLDQAARIDVPTGRIAVSVDVCDTPADVAATASSAWVVCSGDQMLWLIDRAGSIVARIQLDGIPTSVVADGEQAWVTLRAD